MKILAQHALSIGTAAALLAGCGGAQPSIGTPGAMQQASALAARSTGTSYKILYSFGAPPDGNYPHSDLIGTGGTFYGTTFAGGANYCGSVRCGTVFSITTGGSEEVLHNFGSGTDGSLPFAGLTTVGGTLYGTTGNGGAYDAGTVFSITTGGTENVLHSFGGGTDGNGPVASLIDVNGTLYGTTEYGGANNAGTVFSITTDGVENVLYSFAGGTDGNIPEAGLIDVVVATGERQAEHFRLGPEHRRILSVCRRPMPVVDLTSEIDLPIGVVRVLLGDLTGEGLLRVVSSQRQPVPDESLLRMVLDGLESL